MHYPHGSSKFPMVIQAKRRRNDFSNGSKVQEYDNQIVHQPGDTHCNGNVPQWLRGAEEALRGPIPEFTECNSALFEAERAVRTKTREKTNRPTT